MYSFRSSLFALLIGASPAFGATLNGDFSEGLTGYTAAAETNLSGPQDPAGFVGLSTQAGNPFAVLSTDPILEALVLYISLKKTFTATSATSMLSFDFGRVFDVANTVLPAGFVPSNNDDRFTVQLRDLNAAGTIFDLGLYTLFDNTNAGTVADPFGNASDLDVSFGAASDPFFDTSVSADLTSLIGRELELTFTLRDYFDGRQSGVGIDNISLALKISTFRKE